MAGRSLNKVMLIGNLTRDPNLRFTPNGTAICSFGLATNRSWVPADGGEKQEKVEFHNIVAWSKLAELCGQLLHKGDKTFVEGRLQTREWKGEDGQDHRITEIVIDNMMLLGGGRGKGFGQDDDSYSDSSAQPAEKVTKKATKKKVADSEPVSDNVTSMEDVSEDIPF